MSDLRPTAVITGATSGIGRATACALANKGVQLLLLGRREKEGRALAEKICQRHGAHRATFIAADLSEPAQVRAAVKAIQAITSPIDFLINNAGARNDTYHPTSQGHELTFACNHLGHFLLSCLLLENLTAASAARIITVSSGNHGSVPANGHWELSRESYDRRVAYARSKMANIVFASELGRRLQSTPITSGVYEPGGIVSGFARNNGFTPWLRHVLSHLLKRDLATPSVAARGIVRLCIPPLPNISGRYFRRETDVAALTHFHSPADATHLWNLSVDATGINEAEIPITWRFVRPTT